MAQRHFIGLSARKKRAPSYTRRLRIFEVESRASSDAISQKNRSRFPMTPAHAGAKKLSEPIFSLYSLTLLRHIHHSTTDLVYQSRCPVFPSILPTRTVYTSLRLLALILSTILTFHLLLHDIIIGPSAVGNRDDPECQRNAHEPDHLVEERPICKHHGAIVESLFDGIVACCYGAIVVRAVFEDSELFVEVAGEEGQEADDGEDDVGDEGVGAGGEGCGEAG
jgi:hypothetical protein